jgi:hypothetical protein
LFEPASPSVARTTIAGSSTALAARPKRQRSAVTNGRRSFVAGDGKSAWARRRNDILELHLDDIGGRAFLSEAQISLASRASSIEVELEQMEGKLSKGEPVDLDAFTRASSHLRRILETLGVARAKRDVTPSLSAYLSARPAVAPIQATPPRPASLEPDDEIAASDAIRESDEGHPIGGAE